MQFIYTLKWLNIIMFLHVLIWLFDRGRLLINKITFSRAIYQRLFEQSACMISRFNEIIPFDRPLSSTSSVLPDLPLGFSGILKGKHLNQNVLIANPVAISLFPLGLQVFHRHRGKRKKMLLKMSPKNPRGHALWFQEKDVYVCAYSSKVYLLVAFSLYPSAVTLNLNFFPRFPSVFYDYGQIYYNRYI